MANRGVNKVILVGNLGADPDAAFPACHLIPRQAIQRQLQKSGADKAKQPSQALREEVRAALTSADRLANFQEFKTTAIENNRAALAMNRTMMAPIR